MQMRFVREIGTVFAGLILIAAVGCRSNPAPTCSGRQNLPPVPAPREPAPPPAPRPAAQPAPAPATVSTPAPSPAPRVEAQPAPVAAPTSGTSLIRVKGSTTVGPIAKSFAIHFMAVHPDVEVKVVESGSSSGAKALIAGECDVATMSRGMKDVEMTTAHRNRVSPLPFIIALDALAVAVHPDNPIDALTVDQLRDIFLGKTTNWKDLGGKDEQIMPIVRDESSGTFESFENLVMKKAKCTENSAQVGSNDELASSIEQVPSSIGYIGLGFVSQHNVKAIKINGVEPSKDSVIKGTYPLIRALYMYTNGSPSGMLSEFMNLYRSAPGRRMIEEIGFVALPE